LYEKPPRQGKRLSDGRPSLRYFFKSSTTADTGPPMPDLFTLLASSRFSPSWSFQTNALSEGFH